MKIVTRRAILLGLILALAGVLGAFQVQCPVDGFGAYFTGRTRVDPVTGKLLQEYKCPNGHLFWVV